MWKRFLHFVQYNNAFTIILFVLFAGSSVTFAASPDARGAVYASNSQVISVDNAYLLAQDFDTYSFDAEVGAVTEDDEKYYVDYTYRTVELHDGAWMDVHKHGTITAFKKSFVGKDLGLYVAEQLSQVVRGLREDLAGAQKQAQEAGQTKKVVTTLYSGLVGQLLSPDSETFPGYTPVVIEASSSEPRGEELAAYLRNGTPYAREDATSTDGTPSATSDPNDVATQVANSLSGQARNQYLLLASLNPTPKPGAPVITIMGRNPAVIDVGDSYSDLGATVDDDKDHNIGLKISGDFFDTSTAGTFRVHYLAIDNDGNLTEAVRFVMVVKPGDSHDVAQFVQTLPTITPPAPAETAPATTVATTSDATSTDSTATTTPPSDPAPVVTPPDDTSSSTPPDGGSTDASSTPPVTP